MDLLNLISKRRSVREYKTDEIEQEKIDYILECARLAPSAVNYQPWKFLIVKSHEKKELLRQCYHREWFAYAPLYIIALADTTKSWKRKSDNKDHGDIDVALAVEHIVLAVEEKGLGTCWVCNFNTYLLKEVFNLPDHLVPVALLPVGYPAKEIDPVSDRKQIQDIVDIL